MRGLTASRAYQQSARHRGLRDQEADVFMRVNAGLRQGGDGVARCKALADNDRLWIAVMDLMRSTANELPETIRGALLSVGHAVRREVAEAEPDLAFLIGINEQVAAGLSGI